MAKAKAKAKGKAKPQKKVPFGGYQHGGGRPAPVMCAAENRHGEQWIFTCNRATREASLRDGNAGWARAHPVRDGRADGLILAPEEAAWLQACWSATRA